MLILTCYLLNNIFQNEDKIIFIINQFESYWNDKIKNENVIINIIIICLRYILAFSVITA